MSNFSENIGYFQMLIIMLISIIAKLEIPFIMPQYCSKNLTYVNSFTLYNITIRSIWLLSPFDIQKKKTPKPKNWDPELLGNLFKRVNADAKTCVLWSGLSIHHALNHYAIMPVCQTC